MSRMLPQETVNHLRHQTDVSVRIYGIACTLHIPTNLNAIDENTIYTTHEAYTYVTYTTEVFIDWSPNQQRLRELGLHMENEIPIIAWFANKFLEEGASEPEFDVEIRTGSYFTVDLQYIPDKMDVEELEIVDILVRGIHDKVALKAYKIAPRRVL
jgi:hypothetical protein